MDKNTLKSYQSIKREIRQIEGRLAQLEAAATAPGAQRLTGVPVYHNEDHDRMADYVAKADELRTLYHEKMVELLDTEKRIEEAIMSLDGSHRILIRARYIEGKRWEEICVALNYGWAQVHRMHGEALEILRFPEA